MMLYVVLSLASALCVLGLALSNIKIANWLYVRRARQRGCEPPKLYSHQDPILGRDLPRLFQQANIKGNGTAAAAGLFKTYGKTFMARTWGQLTIFTCDARVIQAVHTTYNDALGAEPFRKPANKGLIADSVFISDGDVWKHSRDLLKPIFKRSQIADLHNFELHIQRALNEIPTDGSTIDLQELFRRLFLDVSTQFLFGSSANILGPDQPRLDHERFIQSYDAALAGVTKRMDIRNAWLMAVSSSGASYKEAIRYVHGFVDGQIEAAMADCKPLVAADKAPSPSKHDNGDSNGDGKENLDESLEESSQDDDDDDDTQRDLLHELLRRTRDKRLIRNELLSIFMPARDASTFGLETIFFQLARAPAVWRRLREEVRAAPRPFTFLSLKNMPYLQAVVKEGKSWQPHDRFSSPCRDFECLRSLPFVVRTDRMSYRDLILPYGGGADGSSPLWVPKGTHVEPRINLVMTDASYWGADADVFRPERWLGEEGAALRPKWEYIPFLGGPRICPAQQMVLTQFAYLLARFVETYARMENRDEVWEYVEDVVFTKRSRNGVKVAFFRE